MKTKKPLFAFVLMPFDNKFNDVYQVAIKETATEFGIVAERVDDQIYSESILERILRQIENADFIIADMTGQNPNVFYEVGYAHAKEKICTLITQSTKDIPFDLKHHRHIQYGDSLSELKVALRKEFQWLRDESERKRKSIFEVEFRPVNAVLSNEEWRSIGKFDLKIDILNRSTRRTPEIDALYLYTTKHWKFSQGGEECPSAAVEGEPEMIRHAIVCPMSRIAAGAFAQATVEGTRRYWSKFSGETKEEKYVSRGELRLEIATSEGTFVHTESMEVEFEEFPF